MSINNKCYALYRGDDFIAVGTISEVIDQTKIPYYTIFSLKTPTHMKRIAKQMRTGIGHALELVEVND